MGMLAGMIVPRFGGTVRSVESEEAAQRLRSELDRWRVRAARHNQRIEIEIGPGGRSELMVDAFDAPRHPAWDFTPLEVGETRAGLRRRTVFVDFAGTLEADPPHLVFYPDGTSSESVIRLDASRGRSYRIDVRPHDVLLWPAPRPRT
jgi:hypothetical protein